MNKNNVIQVFYDGKVVGQLAMRGHSTSFEYDDDWIKTGFPISPFSLPLEKQVFTPTKPYFNGLFGAFADSLPDAWGQLLLNRMLKKYKQNLDDTWTRRGAATASRSATAAGSSGSIPRRGLK